MNFKLDFFFRILIYFCSSSKKTSKLSSHRINRAGSRCQFHQHFTDEFFIRTSFRQLTCNQRKRRSYKKRALITLMKLTLVFFCFTFFNNHSCFAQDFFAWRIYVTFIEDVFFIVDCLIFTLLRNSHLQTYDQLLIKNINIIVLTITVKNFARGKNYLFLLKKTRFMLKLLLSEADQQSDLLPMAYWSSSHKQS